ncbi:MAG: hypothetical protein OEW64_04300 [Gammaproteobacteria bacterium]|nr:hypothetical protein [Gammaproteobacteria bacterium]MDH5303300.1 hypothetical protein [Gammaproteobacteria bacterium]MDH5321617.1 hypothetical protein [Gammaproteobacteria bacterium]
MAGASVVPQYFFRRASYGLTNTMDVLYLVLVLLVVTRVFAELAARSGLP